MAANGISTLGTKALKQVAKLDIAQAKKQGKVVAKNGTISGAIDATKNYYRINNTYSLAGLATQYTDNAVTNNPNSGGLAVGRPWSSVATLPTGYVTLAGLTWAPMTTGGTYAESQTHAAGFTGLGFSAGTWRSATVAEIQSLTAVLSYANAQSVYGWVFSVHAFNIWSSVSGQIVNFNTGANNGTATSNRFNFLLCKTPA
jgi:hypothetical protein